MEELMKKLSSYNIFNYLLPGIVFVVLAKEVIGHSLYVDNIVLGVFYYYFFGLLISRIGSVIIEPLFIKLGIIKFLEYPRFVKASKLDEKIDTLSEANNMFRTLIALVFCLGLMRLTLWLVAISPLIKTILVPFLLVLTLVLLILSYRKQSDYITKRILATETGDKPAKK